MGKNQQHHHGTVQWSCKQINNFKHNATNRWSQCMLTKDNDKWNARSRTLMSCYIQGSHEEFSINIWQFAFSRRTPCNKAESRVTLRMRQSQAYRMRSVCEEKGSIMERKTIQKSICNPWSGHMQHLMLGNSCSSNAFCFSGWPESRHENAWSSHKAQFAYQNPDDKWCLPTERFVDEWIVRRWHTDNSTDSLFPRPTWHDRLIGSEK